MLKTNDQHKLLLETFGLGPGLDVPPAYDSMGFSDVVVRNELKTSSAFE